MVEVLLDVQEVYKKLRKYDSNGHLVWEKTSTDKNRYNNNTVDFTITTLSVFK